VTDGSGRTASATQKVTVTDDEDPTITAPGDVTTVTSADGTGNCTTTATLGTPTTADNCSVSGVKASVGGTEINPATYAFGIGTTDVVWTVTDGSGRTASATQKVTVTDNEKPTITTCPANKTSATDVGSCTKTFTLAQIGTPVFSDNCGATISWVRSDGATTLNAPFGFGLTTITWTATDGAGNKTSCDQTININQVATSITVSVSPNSQQYSDKVTFTATVSPATCGTGVAGGAVTFKVGDQTMGSATVNASGVATLPDVSLLEPTPFGTLPTGQMAPGLKDVTATFVPDDATAIGSSLTSKALTITKEDATASYTGAVYASTSSPTSSNATVTLSATIKDITADDPGSDNDAGDIRNAIVRFINRDNNTVIGTASVGLVNAGDTKVGTATLNWNVNITGDAQSFTIGVIVDNYYVRDNSDDNTVITVAKPLGDLFITGGGYLNISSSAGIKSATAGTKNNFGFNVKYNKSRTNLQGNINTIIRKMEADGLHVYQVKGNSMTSLTVNTACPKTAVFNGKASIQDITNPASPIPVDGNATLQVTMTDNGEPGKSDMIAITVWNKAGGLWFASNWNGTKTVEQVLGGGNLKVHGGAVCGSTTPAIAARVITPVPANELEVKVQNNPSTGGSAFRLQLRSNDRSTPIALKVTDMSGRPVEAKQGLANGSTVELGRSYIQGMYMVEVVQGDQRKVIKLMKQ
jgi:hypothetical protein